MRALFDINVLVAAFITDGACSRFLSLARRGKFKLFTCPVIISELERVLSGKLGASSEQVRTAISLVLEAAEMVYPREYVFGLCRDKDDDLVISCALAAEVDYLVTGDKDLLDLDSPFPFKIVSPKTFRTLL